MKAAYRITILVDEVPFKYKQYLIDNDNLE